MVDEKERYDQEEEEYHFTDDQVNYDIDTETPQGMSPESKTPSGSFLTKLTPRIKAILVGVLLVIVMTVVLRMMVPATPPTEFASTTTTTPTTTGTPVTPVTQKPAEPVVAKNKSPAEVAAAQPNLSASVIAPPGNNGVVANPSAPVGENPNISPPMGSAPPPTTGTESVANGQPQLPPAMPPAEVQASTGPGSTMAVNNPSAPNNVMSPPPGVPTAGANAMPPAMPNGSPVNTPNLAALNPAQNPQAPGMPSTTATIPPPPLQQPAFSSTGPATVPMVEAQTRNVTDRLASLEQQNAAIMNLLQTEYSQKITDTEAENSQIRGKIDEITKRVNRMDAALAQITQLLQSMSKPAAIASQPVVRSHEPPHMIYSVQAIIPGRAWLKSEAGDTITVAEGDVLRDYGRITKIDPYDGIVNIDVGNKIITLSYGNAE